MSFWSVAYLALVLAAFFLFAGVLMTVYLTVNFMGGKPRETEGHDQD